MNEEEFLRALRRRDEERHYEEMEALLRSNDYPEDDEDDEDYIDPVELRAEAYYRALKRIEQESPEGKRRSAESAQIEEEARKQKREDERRAAELAQAERAKREDLERREIEVRSARIRADELALKKWQELSDREKEERNRLWSAKHLQEGPRQQDQPKHVLLFILMIIIGMILWHNHSPFYYYIILVFFWGMFHNRL